MATLEETHKLLDRGRVQIEKTREDRVRNYAVKRSDGFTCTQCPTGVGLLVCDVGQGELETRCKQHVEGKVMPGQWNAR